MIRIAGKLVVAGLVASVAGCAGGASFSTVPHRSLNLAALGETSDPRRPHTDPTVQDKLDRKPLARFPATIAVVRVQAAAGRSSKTAETWGNGRWSIVFTRDLEKPEHVERLQKMPLVQGVAPINRLMVPDNLRTDEDLRAVAAALQADMLLIYTVDTIEEAHSRVPGLDVLTLGLLPIEEARAAATASAVLMDTRNGYVYGSAEATARGAKLANAWVMEQTLETNRRNIESEAFEKLVVEVERMWGGVVRGRIAELKL